MSMRPRGQQGALVIGEVAQAHDGSLGTAHAYIDAIADAGADAVKFQTHIAAAESTPSEPWRVPFSKQDASRYEYWRRMEFTPEQWAGLRDHAVERGLVFLSSPFSLEALDLLIELDVPMWKVASGEVANDALIDAMAATGRPVLLSSGMSTFDELDRAVDRVRAAGAPVAVLQCATAYPSPPEAVGLNLLREFADRWGCPVGLSDHSGTIFPALAATALGAAVIEVHVALSRKAFGPDVTSSVTDVELAMMVEGVRHIERALAHPVDKDAAAAATQPMRALFGKSIVARGAMPAGTVLSRDMLAFKKPGTGIPVARLDEVLGRRLTRSIEADHLISVDDLEEG